MESKRSENLCNFYILPLLGLNKTSFGGSMNFVNSYLSTDSLYVVVELLQPTKETFESHTNYVLDFEDKGRHLLVFGIPEEYLPSVEMFKAGKYSQFQTQAKELIKKKSGLNYKVPIGGGKVRSARELLALDKDQDLRRLLEEELKVKIDAEAELMDIPNDNNFYNLRLQPIQQG